MQKSVPLRAVPVVRDDDGFWTHPDYFSPAGDREYGAPGEFEQWLQQHQLEYTLHRMADEVTEEVMERYVRSGSPDCRNWTPETPAGPGWFTGSIHDTEDDGPVCVWLRPLEVPCDDC